MEVPFRSKTERGFSSRTVFGTEEYVPFLRHLSLDYVVLIINTENNEMNGTSHSPIAKRPAGVSAIAIINGIAFLLTLAFWCMVAFKKLIPFPSELAVISERANAAVTWGFLIGDIVFSAPLLLVATVGLWRPSALGWTAAQMVNILWVYSMTVVLMRDAFTVLSPGGMLFLPFPFIAVWATIYLWKHRTLFWTSEMIRLQSKS